MAALNLRSIQPLPEAFAVRLLRARAFVPPSPLVDQARYESALSADLLQLSISICAVGKGFVLFDFSKNAELVGGAVDVESQKSDPYFSAQALARQKIVRGRTRVMNAFLACLYEGSQPVFPGGVQASLNAENYMTGAKGQHTSWAIEGPSTNPDDVDVDCPVAVIANTTAILAKILHHYGNEIVEALSLLQVATVEYRVQNFGGALALGWFVIEFLLTGVWRLHHPTGKRPDAAPMSKQLVSEGHLTQDMLDKLDAVRRKRNDFVHELTPVEAEDAGDALRLAGSMISDAIGSQFRLSLTYSWRR